MDENRRQYSQQQQQKQQQKLANQNRTRTTTSRRRRRRRRQQEKVDEERPPNLSDLWSRQRTMIQLQQRKFYPSDYLEYKNRRSTTNWTSTAALNHLPPGTIDEGDNNDNANYTDDDDVDYYFCDESKCISSGYPLTTDFGRRRFDCYYQIHTDLIFDKWFGYEEQNNEFLNCGSATSEEENKEGDYHYDGNAIEEDFIGIPILSEELITVESYNYYDGIIGDNLTYGYYTCCKRISRTRNSTTTEIHRHRSTSIDDSADGGDDDDDDDDDDEDDGIVDDGIIDGSSILQRRCSDPMKVIFASSPSLLSNNTTNNNDNSNKNDSSITVGSAVLKNNNTTARIGFIMPCYDKRRKYPREMTKSSIYPNSYVCCDFNYTASVHEEEEVELENSEDIFSSVGNDDDNIRRDDNVCDESKCVSENTLLLTTEHDDDGGAPTSPILLASSRFDCWAEGLGSLDPFKCSHGYKGYFVPDEVRAN